MEQNLSSLNLTTECYKTLKSSGFTYVKDINETEDSKEWVDLTLVPVTKTALDIYCNDNESGTIYTFNGAFDELLENELVPGNVVEICGEPGSGKSQICFQLCINVQLPKWIGGKEGNALYLCTNYNFSTERLKELGEEILKKLSCSGDSKKRKLSPIYFTTVIYLQKWLHHNKIRLLIIDCITPIIQQLDYTEKRHFMYNLFVNIQKLAIEYGFVVIITNNVTLRTKSVNNTYKTPALGEAYFHRVNTRVLLERKSPNYFKATLKKSTIKKQSSVLFNFS
ncbi:Rad51 [Popillia japonica]|uniref:DNA repair protein RAD51 homolog 3 n=1 Tax=Popillia japonica TaxID=7064 RepID=A0AAW1MDB7_POPJA